MQEKADIMNYHLRVFILFYLLTSSACVSVQLPFTAKGSKAKGVEYSEPSAPFKSLKVEQVDAAWIHNRSGNIISFSSECGTDPSLEQMSAEVLNSLDSHEEIDNEEIDYNGRKALTSTVNGKLDGVNVSLRYLVFKKNSCNFTLTHSGKSSSFKESESAFEAFLKGFRAP